MKLDMQAHGSVTLIRVDEDRIDASVAIQFKERFRSLVDGGAGPVILDLSQVDFLDSSGLGAVVAARKLIGADRPLELAGLTAAVDKVMTLTRMNTVFPIHDGPEAALASHGEAPAA